MSQTGGDWAAYLPDALCKAVKQVTGADSRDKKADPKKHNPHLGKAYPDPEVPLAWYLLDSRALGDVGPADKVYILDAKPDSLIMTPDHNRRESRTDRGSKQGSGNLDGARPKKGWLDPALIVKMSDLHRVDVATAEKNGRQKQTHAGQRLIASSPYVWTQYVAELSKTVSQRILYSQSASSHGLPGGPPLNVGDIMEVHPFTERDLITISGGDLFDPGQTVMMSHGLVVRPGMGISFCNKAAAAGTELHVLHGYVRQIETESPPLPTAWVQVLLNKRNLPRTYPVGAMASLGVFQTSLTLRVDQDDILSVFPVLPYALSQNLDHCRSGADSGSEAIRLSCIVVGHVDLTYDCHHTGHMSLASLQHFSPQVLEALGKGKAKIHLHRTVPLDPRRALTVISNSAILFNAEPTLQFVSFVKDAVKGFAKSKARSIKLKTTDADNTLRLNMNGKTLMRMLHELVDPSECTVSLADGVLIAKVSTFVAAAAVLGSEDGEFDFTTYGYGHVQLLAPIAFKWELFDTRRVGNTSRCVDGFASITFSAYVEKDRHKAGEIYGTKGHKRSRRQLDQQPSAMCLSAL